MKQILLFALLSLTLLSCQQKEVPKYPDHPITYEVVGDSVTVYHYYVSEWRIDSNSYEAIPIVYRQFPLQSTTLSDTTEIRTLQNHIDSVNTKLIELEIYEPPVRLSLKLSDSLSLDTLYHNLLKRIPAKSIENTIPARNFFINENEMTLLYESVDVGAVVNKVGNAFIITDSCMGLSEELTVESLNKIKGYNESTYVGTNAFLLERVVNSIRLELLEENLLISDLVEILDLFNSQDMLFSFVLSDSYTISQSANSADDLLRTLFGGKPIIYLYPEVTTNISVLLNNTIDLTFTYPHYPDSGWNIQAEPSGDLTDTSTGKQYYSLFWEGYIQDEYDFETGFVVPSNDIVSFLEEKLEILGLNFREAQEFILYWAPVLEQNEFSLIHFATDEYAEAVPLTITPEPDTEIRIMMSFKSVGLGHEVIRQELTPLERSGFTVVEWGGSNYDRDGLVQYGV